MAKTAEQLRRSRGALTEREREVANPHVEHRRDMPESAFLRPSTRSYPVKVRDARTGEWRFDRDLLLAAERDATMHGEREIARRAKEIREREFGEGARDGLVAALRRRFSSPAEAMRALGLDSSLLLKEDCTMAYDRHYDRARDRRREDDEAADRLAHRDGDLSEGERARIVKDRLRRISEDDEEDFDPQEILEIMSEHFPQETREAIQEMGEDRRGPRSWARDRRELRRVSRDLHFRRARDAGRRPHLVRDEPAPFYGRPEPGGRMTGYPRGEEREEFYPDRSHSGSVEDRRRAHDAMAYDASGASTFDRVAAWLGPQAAGIERIGVIR